MPSSLSYELERALGAIRSILTDRSSGTDVQPTFTWNSADYVCTPGALRKGTLFGAGGFTPEWNLTIAVQASLLPTPGPKANQFITYQTEQYRIALVTTSPDGSTVELICLSPDRGAGIREREV